MEKVLPWFALKTVSGIGNLLYKRLIDRFGSPELIFSSSTDLLCSVKGVSPRIATSIRQHTLPDWVKAELDEVNRLGFGIIVLTDPAYPPLLREIPDPPPYLYVYGQLDRSMNNVAVVGSRNATAYGISTARRISAGLTAHGITIISGMARGIDTAAHNGALDGKGRTIAVLGSGLNEIYPPENNKLFHKIAENGAVISEFPLKTGPEPHNFPIRNRVISGISLGTVVVEATRRSGSLITARLAAEQNREVFAVPGSINSFKSAGPHHLIKQGAKLVAQPQDILEELQLEPVPDIALSSHETEEPVRTSLTKDERRLFGILGPYPMHIDEIIRKTSFKAGTLSSILLQMELKGIIQQMPGKFFSLSDDTADR